MNLTRLDLFAFKTFAQRTEIAFPVGVTCVVGPNGSGKSNIADAILWVLGESNVRHLRGDRAQDVIFSGTGKRRPLGMAEASLTFDNSDGRLGLDDPEITVTRRVYRNGEGEYFINRAACRLKDIHELFLDTGIGRDAYSMVGQSDVDAILSARAEERRQLFEEAAGIKKYRVRKNEALRKLESTGANLVRVTDILSEVERRVGPLERAAAVAREFRGLDARREELERVVLAHDASRLSAELETQSSEAAEVSREADAARAARAEAEAREAAVRLRLAELERALDEDRERAESLRAERTRREAEGAILARRREEAARREAELSEMMEALAERLETARAQNAAATEQAAALEARRDELVQQLASARAANEAERAELESGARRISALLAEEGRLRTVTATRASEAAPRGTKRAACGESLAALSARAEELKKEAEDAAAEAAAAEVRIRELAERRAELESERRQREERRAALDVEAKAGEARVAEARKAAAGLSARHRALAEMAEQHEGFYAGVRAVLEASRNGRMGAGFRAVADVIKVPPGLETAIETALGAHLQDIICPTDADAKAAIAYLKAGDLGRATFLPLDLLRPAPRVEARPAPGVLGWAADLVTCDPEHAPALELLLGRVLVVENLDAAVALVRRDRLPIRVVSREGEIVSGQGSITGGRGRGAQTQLLARKREMEDLEIRVADADSEAEAHAATLAETRDALAASDQAARDAAAALNDLRLLTAEAERRREYAAAEARRLAADAEAREKEYGAADARASALAERADGLDAAADEASERLDAAVAERVALQESSAGPDEENRKALLELEVEAAAVRERLNAARTEASRAAETARLTRDELARRADQLQQARQEAGDPGTTDADLASAMAALEARIREATAALEGRKNERDAALQESGTFREQARAAETRSDAALERLRKLEARVAGLAGERAHVLARLREILWPNDGEEDGESGREGEGESGRGGDEGTETAAVSEEEAAELLRGVDIPDGFSRHAAVIELNRLKRQIAALGPVSLSAEQEYEETAERLGFLRMQRDDLVSAEETLRRAIREIDDSTRETFLATFRKVQEQFDVMFRRLFGGGNTRLELTDPEDLLETGVEIIVQPPGKRLQNLQLLSGGERALTAAALLFAFLKVKPSPFVVLDEVDAPLDEANVGRFAAVLREFAQNSQFIVITHNRGTMEAADALYGVTMQEPGISTLVSLRLEDKHETAAANGNSSGSASVKA